MTSYKRRTSALDLSMAVMILSSACSPLSLSQSKFRTARSANETQGTAGITAPVGANPAPAEKSAALTGVPVSVRSIPAYFAETRGLPEDQKIAIAPETDADAFEAFKTARTITIHFDGHAPDRCKAFMGLSIPEGEITNFGWNNEIRPVTIDCVAQKDGDWKISISESVNQDTWTQLAANLEGLTFFAAANHKMSVVKSTLSPGNQNTAANGGPGRNRVVPRKP